MLYNETRCPSECVKLKECKCGSPRGKDLGCLGGRRAGKVAGACCRETWVAGSEMEGWRGGSLGSGGPRLYFL